MFGLTPFLNRVVNVVELHPVGFASEVEAVKCMACARQTLGKIESVGMEIFRVVDPNFELLNLWSGVFLLVSLRRQD